MHVAFLICLTCALGGCASAEINEDAKYSSASFSSVAEYKALSNLADIVKRPWAMPAFESLGSGTLQATHTAGFNFSVPFTRAFSGAVSSIGSSTINLNPAQTADNASYTTQYVQDPDDLRRLSALFHYALCPDFGELSKDWIAAAGQGTLNAQVARAFADAEALNPHIRAPNAKKAAALYKKAAEAPNAKAAARILAQAASAAAAAPAPAGGPNSDQASKVDTLENEERHLSDIVNSLPPDYHWIWPKTDSGPPVRVCRNGASFADTNAVLIGTFNGVTFYADPDKLREFLLLANYAVPNTIGTVYLNDQGAIVGQPTQRPQTFQIIGNP
jgi:hypothetical protein